MRLEILFCCMLLLPVVTLAHGPEDFAAAEELIRQQVPCDDLTNEQLELIGDYYMEQMHPGEAHEVMDEMMGGEGSAQLEAIHINMARSFYCGEHEVFGAGMMNMMMGRGPGGISMMHGYGPGMWSGGLWTMSFFWLFFVALAAFIFGVIFWLTYKLIVGKKRR